MELKLRMHDLSKPAILLTFLLAFLPAASKALTLSCDMGASGIFYFKVDTTNDKAGLLFDDNPQLITGSLKKTEFHYQMDFPKTGDRNQTIVVIDRFSGKITWEIGSQPFGKRNTSNIFLQGICKENESNPKF